MSRCRLLPILPNNRDGSLTSLSRGHIPLDDDEATSIGRKNMLNSYFVACGCVDVIRTTNNNNNNTKTFKRLCQNCQDLEQWGLKYISKCMMKIHPFITTTIHNNNNNDSSSNHKKQWRLEKCGLNASNLIYIHLKDSNETIRNNEKDLLSVGDEIHIGVPCRYTLGDQSERRMDTKLKYIMDATKPIIHNTKHIIPKQSSTHAPPSRPTTTSLPSPSVENQNGILKSKKSNSEHTHHPNYKNHKDNIDKNSSNSLLSYKKEVRFMLSELENASTTNDDTKSLTKNICTDNSVDASCRTDTISPTMDEESQIFHLEKEESSHLEKNSKCHPKVDNVHVNHDVQEHLPQNKHTDLQTNQEKMEIANSSQSDLDQSSKLTDERNVRVFLLPLGRNMSHSRIRIFTQILQRKGLEVVAADYKESTSYWVIDENVNVQTVASKIGFVSFHDMAQFVIKVCVCVSLIYRHNQFTIDSIHFF